MAVRIQLRRDTAANWLAADPVLYLGEVGIETDTLKSKVGNGSATWTSLDYLGSVSPSFSGTPTAPTAPVGTSTTQLATTAFTIANRGDKYLATSTTSNAISLGNKTFTIQPGLSYIPTQDVTIVYDNSNHMHGIVISYDSITGVMVVDVEGISGTGTFNAWTLNVGGLISSQGALLSANNLSDVANASTSLTNLGGVSTSRQVISGTGLSGGGDLTADRTLSVQFGTSSTTACAGDDARLSDSRSPSGTAGGALTGTYPNPGLATVPVASGGTGSTTASGARTNLGLAINSDVQAYSASTTLLGNTTTGTGSIVLATSPSLTTPAIGAATGTSLALSSAAANTFTVTAPAYAGSAVTWVRFVPHTGLDPLTINNNGGWQGAYLLTSNNIRTSYIGFGGNLNLSATPVLGITDSRLRLQGGEAPASMKGFDLSDVRLFNTYTSASNYERANLYWNSNTFTIGTEALGSGTVRPFAIAIGGVNRLVLAATGEITTGTWNATTIGVAYGGTGATDAAGARTNLGLVINTDVQAYNANTTTLGNSTTGSGSIVLASSPTLTKPALSGVAPNVRFVNSSSNATGTDVVLLCDAASGVLTITMPDASTVPNQMFVFKKLDSSANAVTVFGGGSFDGSGSVSLTSQNQSITIVSNGVNYFII